MKSKTTRILQILTSAYGALYLAVIVSSFIQGDLTFSNLVDKLGIIPVLIFIAGLVLSWLRLKTGGIILMVWTASIWFYDLCLAREVGGGLASIMSVPAMVLGSLLLLEWYKGTETGASSKKLQWRYLLRVLLINYLVLYAIVVFSEVVTGRPREYLSLPFILFPVLLLVFLAGFALAWKREILAGYIFLLWSAILVFGNLAYFDLRDSGPWLLFGIPVLVQGLFYLNQHYQYRAK
jgi:membrane protease YdiL (CAAX protease family)